MKTSKIIISLSLLLVFFVPQITLTAGTLEFGKECLSNHDSDCISGDCEKASDDKWYCDCDDDADCDIFKKPNEKWTCKDGAYATYNIDYCLKDGASTADDIKTPIGIKDTTWLESQIDTPFDSDVMNQATVNEINKILKEPRLSISIPGLKFTTKEEVAKLTKEEAGGTFMYIPYLGEYLAAAYRYGVIAGAVIAIVMIINAGFNWAISGGNSEKIKYAQTRIAQSTVGLVILVGSYVLLYAINPELVQFRNLRVMYIPKQEVDSVYNGSVQQDIDNPPKIDIFSSLSPLPLPNTTGMNYGFNNVPYYEQGAEPWGKIKYGNGSACETFRASACGPTSFAMVYQFYKLNVDPRNVAQVSVNSGARVCKAVGGGTTGYTLIEALKKDPIFSKFKIDWITGSDKNEKALEILRKKQPLIQSGEHAGFNNKGKLKTYRGHYMVLTGVDIVDGQEIIRVNDPGRGSPSEGIVYLTMEQFKKAPRDFIYIHP